MINSNLFDREGSVFMGTEKILGKCSIGIFGVDYDGTTSYKPGTRFGPNAIRNVSQSLETYCPYLEKDLEDIKYFDFGKLLIDLKDSNSVIQKVYKATRYLIENSLKPLILGGEHSITTGVIKALVEKYPNLVLVQLDAHADLRDIYLNNQHSHACTMQRCLEILPSKKIIQVGIRSGTKIEFTKMRLNNQLLNFNVGDSSQKLSEKLNLFKESPIYLTVDLDWFDPSLVSGTGTPEPGGFFWNDFQNIIFALSEFKIIGGDIVELSPDIDQSGISSVVAAKVARSLIMTLDNIPKKELS